MSSWKARLLMAFTMLAMVIALSVPAMAQDGIGIGDRVDEEELDDLDAAERALLGDLEEILDDLDEEEELAFLDDGGFGFAGVDDEGFECDEFLVEYRLPGWSEDLFAVVDDDDLQEFVDWVEEQGGTVEDITCWEFDF